MELTHHTHNIRIAPRKLRLVTEKVKHLPVNTALALLPVVNHKGALHVHKSLHAARQAAKDQNFGEESLVIQRVWCDEGPVMKRVVGHSRGRMSGIMKKHSHLTIVLSGEQVSKPTRVRKVKASETAPSSEGKE